MMIESDITQADDNIFLDLDFSAHEAESLRIRTDLMLILRNLIQSQSWTTEQAAHHLKTSEEQIQSLMQGEIDRFYIEPLIATLTHVGMQIRLEVLPSVA